MSGGYAPTSTPSSPSTRTRSARPSAVLSCRITFPPADRSRRQSRADDGRPHRDDGVGAEALLDGRASSQPVRTVIPVDGDDAFFATMPAFAGRRIGRKREPAALGAKLVTVFAGNAARGLHTHLASIVLLDPGDRARCSALLDGRYITEARTAAVSAVSSRLLARKTPASLAIIGTGRPGPQPSRGAVAGAPTAAGDGLESEQTRTASGSSPRHDAQRGSSTVSESQAVDHAGEAVVGADIIVLVTSSPTPVVENGWVKPGAHVISVGACRPTQREMDPALDRTRAAVRRFARGRARRVRRRRAGHSATGSSRADHIVAELGELVPAPPRPARATPRSRSSSRWDWLSKM